LIQEQATETENLQLEDEWTPSPPPTDLIFDDGEPRTSNRHRIAMNVLISAVTLAYQEREDYFAGGNMFVYYSSEQARNRDYKGPDFFVALNVDGKKERQGWVVWEEGGRYPDVIVELMSPSTANQDKGKKEGSLRAGFQNRALFYLRSFRSRIPKRLEVRRKFPLSRNNSQRSRLVVVRKFGIMAGYLGWNHPAGNSNLVALL